MNKLITRITDKAFRILQEYRFRRYLRFKVKE